VGVHLSPAAPIGAGASPRPGLPDNDRRAHPLAGVGHELAGHGLTDPEALRQPSLTEVAGEREHDRVAFATELSLLALAGDVARGIALICGVDDLAYGNWLTIHRWQYRRRTGRQRLQPRYLAAKPGLGAGVRPRPGAPRVRQPAARCRARRYIIRSRSWPTAR